VGATLQRVGVILLGMTGGGYFRMKRWRKFSCLIFFIVFFGCATAPNTHVAGNHDKISKEKPSVEAVAAVQVTVGNSYKAPSDPRRKNPLTLKLLMPVPGQRTGKKSS
jgi:hypothetical protein